MESIKKLLKDDGYSLVVGYLDEAFMYRGRGISDLMQILADTKNNLLKDAYVGDKVVGKAAAALMIQGGIKAVYAELISQSALKLFASAAPSIKVSYDKKVEYIANRTQTGWCPMELACKDAKTPEECLARIKEKMAEMKN